jgi:hypothetical protein
VSLIAPGEAHYEIRSSRFWAMFTFQVTRFLFPQRVAADRHGISSSSTSFWLTPWARNEEHMPMAHIAEIEHDRGLIWDELRVESSGGIDPMIVPGLPKGAANTFVAHVRQLMNK